MLRSFLPVGQGAFYRETFNLKEGMHTIVYDCGSLTDLSIVERQIKHEFKRRETVDAVFISHFDEDHINGLPFLLKHCNVKNLFFPLVTTKDKAYLKLKLLLSADKESFLYKFIDNPQDAIDGLDVDNNVNLLSVGVKENEYVNNNNVGIISSGTNVVDLLGFDLKGKFAWDMIPFNFRQGERIDELKKAVAKIFHCGKDKTEDKIEELINNYPKDKDKIKEMYKQVKGTFNTNSMTLFSGTKNSCIGQYYAISKRYFCACYYQFSTENGCLYMGDYDASGTQKWKNLRDAYNEYWEYIGCVQIPHHGSRQSYNNAIAELNAINIISAGCKNSYRHPHSFVIKDLVMNNCLIHIVTENIGSQVDLKVDVF